MYIADSWPVWGMVVVLETIIYTLWPSRLMKKNEYLQFFLFSFSLYWFLMIFLHLCLGGFHHETPITGFLFLTCLLPWITIIHLVYPFKHVKRNPQFTFLSVGITVSAIIIIAIAWILVQFSNM